MYIYDNYDSDGKNQLRDKKEILNSTILKNTNIKYFIENDKIEEENDCYDNIYGSRIQSKIKGFK